MPELTPQDKESYQKLYDSASELQTVACPKSDDGGIKIGESFTLKEFTQVFFDGLTKIMPDELANFEQLQAQVEFTGGYLTMYHLFAEAISSIQDKQKKSKLSKAHQKLLAEYNSLKVSLDAADDDFIDEIVPISSDSLFLGFLEDKDFPIKTWTSQLMSDQVPVLTESQVQALTNAWGIAVSNVLEDAQLRGIPKDKLKAQDQVTPGESITIAHFFCIHDQLEGLYSQLSTAIALTN